MNILMGDETCSGSNNNDDTAAKGDAFVMCALMLDVEAFFEATPILESIFASMEQKKFINKSEFKSTKFMGGSRERIEQDGNKLDMKKKIFTKFCRNIATMDVDIFAVGVSVSKIEKIQKTNGFSKDHIARIFSGIFISDLIQEKTKNATNRDHERTLVILDHHPTNADISSILNGDVSLQDWVSRATKMNDGKASKLITASMGSTDHIVDQTFYNVRSELSRHVQATDALCYVYRRYLDMWDGDERWGGERTYINQLVGTLDKKRYMLKSAKNLKCAKLFDSIKHRGWRA